MPNSSKSKRLYKLNHLNYSFLTTPIIPMASTISHLFISSLLLIISCVSAQSNPKAIALPVNKDDATNQHIVNLTQRTPFKIIPVTLDLGGQFLWVNCDPPAYKSSTYRPARCGSAQCKLANSHSCGTCNAPSRPGCNNNTCGLNPGNPFIRTSTSGDLGSDIVKVRSSNGSTLGRPVTVPNFLFVCAPKFLTKGLAKGSQGIAGLGRTKISLPSQFSSTFKFVQTFAVCLSSSSNPGVVIFGDVPYKFAYSAIVIDVRTVLSYTPLLTNPNSTALTSFPGEKSTEYFIGVKSINVENKTVPINRTLLSFDKDGNGGTKISTVDPYTVLETSIFKAVTQSFEKELLSQSSGGQTPKRVKSVGPFEICYDPNTLQYTRMGPAVPYIDLVFDNEGKVRYTILGTNSMVRVGNDAICLGFINGGSNPRTAIVIGAYQMQDNLVQFDVARSRVGFTSLFLNMNRCDNFKF